jgi:hypothetical protein
MVRAVAYSMLGGLIGMFFGLMIWWTLSGTILLGLLCAITGLAIAGYMNAQNIMDRPFWNRQDVQTVISNETFRDKILPASVRERVYDWMRSKADPND